MTRRAAEGQSKDLPCALVEIGWVIWYRHGYGTGAENLVGELLTSPSSFISVPFLLPAQINCR